MALLADEHTSDRRRKPTDREYLYFALMLIALLLIAGVQIGLSPQTQTSSTPLVPTAAHAH